MNLKTSDQVKIDIHSRLVEDAQRRDARKVETPRERDHRWLSCDLLRHAEKVDELADRVENWDLNPRTALGMIEMGHELAAAATRFYLNELIGPNTKASFRNESGSVGGTNGFTPAGRGSVEYGLMYALGEAHKYETGEYQARNGERLMPTSTLRCQAQHMRCHASSCRVIAQIANDVREGRYSRIG